MVLAHAWPAAHRMMQLNDPRAARRVIRAGDFAGHTAGIAPAFVQGNLCILPKDLALDFAAFCQRNPKPCPVIGMGSPGDRSLPGFGDIDIRTDVPRYRVFRDGRLVDEPTDICAYWSDDLVTFVLGWSFSSFEGALLEAGIGCSTSRATPTCPCTAPTSIAFPPAPSRARWSSPCGR